MILLMFVAYLLACVTGRALKSRSRSSSSQQAEIMFFCPTSFDDGYLLGSFTVPPSGLTGYVSCFDSPDSPFFSNDDPCESDTFCTDTQVTITYEVVEGTRGRQLDITVAWDTWSSWHYTALFSHYNPSESYAGFIGVCDAEGECIAAGDDVQIEGFPVGTVGNPLVQSDANLYYDDHHKTWTLTCGMREVTPPFLPSCEFESQEGYVGYQAVVSANDN